MHGQVKNLPPRQGRAASRDRLKLDERWNFALSGFEPSKRPTAKVPAKETSAGPAAHDSGRSAQAPSTLGQVKNLPPRQSKDEPGSAEARQSVGISPCQGSNHQNALRRKSPRRRLLPARRHMISGRSAQAPSTLGQVKNLPPRQGRPASRDRLKLDKALEFRPSRVRTIKTPHGESPREGDFCRPGGENGWW